MPRLFELNSTVIFTVTTTNRTLSYHSQGPPTSLPRYLSSTTKSFETQLNYST